MEGELFLAILSSMDKISAGLEADGTNRTVNELLLQEITLKAINQILTERDTFLKTLQQNIAKAVIDADTLSPDGIQARLEELQKELIKKANSKQETDIAEFDEALVKKLIEKITIFADRFTVEFKSGVSVEIEA